MDIKLVIWDLDDTLWSGTLAEGDKVDLNEAFADIVKSLNMRGVVSSICSKNDADQAKSKLTEFGLWEEFVFPFIRFAPKGEAVSSMIEQMQLRAPNVLFIDDNVNNLAEVKAREPEINVADARDPKTLELLRGLVVQYEGVRKSRVEKYRALEMRQKDGRENTGTHEEFLRSCEITMAIAERTDNADFASRIEELINRTNQMNFTASRVEQGSLLEAILMDGNLRAYSVFVWDKYGFHGLVGFALIEDRKILRHFLFSCRIMHMGIEQRVLYELKRHYDHPELDISNIPVTPEPCDWIKYVNYADPAIRAKILEKETKKQISTTRIRVMANCQSGAIAHFGGFSDQADADVWPRVFNFQHFATGEAPKLHSRIPPYNDEFASLLFYGAFTDYYNDLWSDGMTDKLEHGLYAECVGAFSKFIESSNRHAFVLLPPEDPRFLSKDAISRGVSEARVKLFNSIWVEHAAVNPRLTVVNISLSATPEADRSELVGTADDIADVAHYRPALLKKIGTRVAEWMESHQAPAPDATAKPVTDVSLGACAQPNDSLHLAAQVVE